MRIIALVATALLALTGCTGESSDYTLTVTIGTSVWGPLDEPRPEPVEHVFENVASGQSLDITGGIGPDEAIVKGVTEDGITLELSEPLTTSSDPYERADYVEEIELRLGETKAFDTPTLDTVSRYEFRLST